MTTPSKRDKWRAAMHNDVTQIGGMLATRAPLPDNTTSFTAVDLANVALRANNPRKLLLVTKEDAQSIASAEDKESAIAEVAKTNPQKAEQLAEIWALAQTIKTSGLIQPTRIERANDGDGYVVVAGNRRLLALLMLGYAQYKLLINVDAEAHNSDVAAMVENIVRQDLSFPELLSGMEELGTQMPERRLSADAMCSLLGYKRSAAFRWARILKTPEAFRGCIRDGEITTIEEADAVITMLESASKPFSLENIRDMIEANKIQKGKLKPAAESKPKATTPASAKPISFKVKPEQANGLQNLFRQLATLSPEVSKIVDGIDWQKPKSIQKSLAAIIESFNK